MARERHKRLESGLLQLYRRKDMSEAQREVLLDAVNEVAWDDAIHVAAPWDIRVSLCGSWDRNLVSLGDPIPGGFAGCWTCMQAADWFDARDISLLESNRRLRVALKTIIQTSKSGGAVEIAKKAIARKDVANG